MSCGETRVEDVTVLVRMSMFCGVLVGCFVHRLGARHRGESGITVRQRLAEAVFGTGEVGVL